MELLAILLVLFVGVLILTGVILRVVRIAKGSSRPRPASPARPQRAGFEVKVLQVQNTNTSEDDSEVDYAREGEEQEKLGRVPGWIYPRGETWRVYARQGIDLEELKSTRAFSFEIVGESFHKSEIGRIIGWSHPRGTRVIEKATLVLEDDNPHDPNAVRVDILGMTVGHLSREDAVRYRGGNCPRECFALVSSSWRGDVRPVEGPLAEFEGAEVFVSYGNASVRLNLRIPGNKRK